tara:strand:- start:54 stop:485 length:432 start_codon:yes stop_codon:yes gene_type:complete
MDRIRKILDCVLKENKDDFSSLLREEIEYRVQNVKSKLSPHIIEKTIFNSEIKQTLNISEENYEESIKFIPILNELSNKKSNISVVFSDNSERVVTSREIENLIQLHDSLNEENQIKLRVSLVRSKESFENSANFAEKHTKSN